MGAERGGVLLYGSVRRWKGDGASAPSSAVAEPFRNYSEQVLELVGDVTAGTVAGAVALSFRVAAASPEALGFPLLHDAADLTAAGIVFDAYAHISEPFPAQEIELLASQLAGAVEDVLGFGEADGVFSVIHSLVVLGYGIEYVDQARLFQRYG